MEQKETAEERKKRLTREKVRRYRAKQAKQSADEVKASNVIAENKVLKDENKAL